MESKPQLAGVTLISAFYGLGVVALIWALFANRDEVAV